MEMNKAHNMLEHEKEIYSRPPRTWLGGTSGSQLGKRPPPSLLPSADQPQSKKTKHSKKPAKEEDVRNTSRTISVQDTFLGHHNSACLCLSSQHLEHYYDMI